MDQVFRERMTHLETLLDGDDIYQTYAASARELEEALSALIRSLPPEHRQLLIGYRECTRLMQLRERTVVCEQMQFKT